MTSLQETIRSPTIRYKFYKGFRGGFLNAYIQFLEKRFKRRRVYHDTLSNILFSEYHELFEFVNRLRQSFRTAEPPKIPRGDFSF